MTPPPINPNAKPGSWISGNYQGMPYSVLPPDGYDAKYSYPVILFLHQYQNETSEPQQTNPWFNTSGFRGRHPCFVIVPLCKINDQTSTPTFNWGGVDPVLQQPMTHALSILDQTVAAYSIDPNRQYLTGNSMGGLGTWGVLTNPDQRSRFAAAMPVSGSCYYHVGNEAAIAAQLKTVPIWSCHGGQDTQVSPQFDQTIYPIMQRIGGLMKFTNDPNGQHDTWDGFYADMNVWDWLFAQSLSAAIVASPTVESADGTTLAIGDTGSITSAAGEVWRLTSAGQVSVGGVTDNSTSNVVQIVYSKGLLFQQNKAGGWWSKAQSRNAWASASSPLPAVTHLTVTAALDAVLAAVTKIKADVATLKP